MFTKYGWLKIVSLNILHKRQEGAAELEAYMPGGRNGLMVCEIYIFRVLRRPYSTVKKSCPFKTNEENGSCGGTEKEVPMYHHGSGHLRVLF